MVQTCIGEPEWALPIKEVKRMSLHYEWWSKAGGGVNYASEISKEEYVKNFVWFENWLDRHFFNKVSDTLLGIIFIGLLLLSLVKFYSTPRKKNNPF